MSSLFGSPPGLFVENGALRDLSPTRDVPKPTPPPPSFLLHPGPTPNIPSVASLAHVRGPAPMTGRSTSSGPSVGLSMPQMLRSASTSSSRTAQPGSGADWRSFVSIEERTALRRKLKEAYKKNCVTYEKLLETVAAVEEELVFATSPARLDYFKAGIEWDNKLLLKRKQLSGHTGVNGDKRTSRSGSSAASSSTATTAISTPDKTSSSSGKKRSSSSSSLETLADTSASATTAAAAVAAAVAAVTAANGTGSMAAPLSAPSSLLSSSSSSPSQSSESSSKRARTNVSAIASAAT